MSKEELIRIKSYVELMSEKLKEPLPAKHAENEATYRAYLQNEVRIAKLKLAILIGDGK